MEKDQCIVEESHEDGIYSTEVINRKSKKNKPTFCAATSIVHRLTFFGWF